MTNNKPKDKTTTTAPSRDELRANLFGSKKFDSTLVSFFGNKIELRQPSLGEVMEFQKADDAGIAYFLIKYAYVPGTDTKVFEPGDLEALNNMPFSGDFIEIDKVMAKLTGVEVAAEVKN